VTLPDPLLRLPDTPLDLPSNVSGEELLHAAFEQVSDHVNLHAMVWPATDKTGKLVCPPDEHVLHELAHEYELADEQDLMTNPRLHTVGFVFELPECDLCGEPARYDVLVQQGGRRVGANLCGDDFLDQGLTTLGGNTGAYLMLRSEIPPHVKATCNQIRAAQGKEPAFESD
jgi:hypothetical protein